MPDLGQAGCGPAPRTSHESDRPPEPRKILIVDDDKELLETYRDLLASLPSRPQVHAASSAARAFALLESESFSLLITDLRMPKIDGFQVLMTVRKRFPSLRTVVLTGLTDEQYRARAYGMGIDLYTEKPTTAGEIKLFGQCIESLLMRGANGGFRGVQSKSLMDLIQLECLSQNSSVLRITNGSLEARIWIQDGDVIDAAVKDIVGEEAFKSIFEWRSGNFESLPGEPSRRRTIFASYHALLLDTAQTMDETGGSHAEDEAHLPRPSAVLAPLARVEGVESLLLVKTGQEPPLDSWGVETPERFAEWTRRTMADFQELGEALNAGTLEIIEAFGPRRHLAVLPGASQCLLAGLDRALSPEQVRETIKHVAARWEP